MVAIKPPFSFLTAYDMNTGNILYRIPNGDSMLVETSEDVGSQAPRGGPVATASGLLFVGTAGDRTFRARDAATGRVLWEHAWPRIQPSVSQPVVLPGDRILLSAGYGIGSRLLQIASDGAGGLRASLVWESTRMKAKFTNLVVLDGFVYGLDDGVLVCLDPATGERRWKSGRYGHGQVILTGRLLIVQTEEGELVLVEPRPDELRELTRFTVFTRKTWNPPALAGHYLFVRNDVEGALYELPLK
jgi:outer membrane protein assembly factor BamB